MRRTEISEDDNDNFVKNQHRNSTTSQKHQPRVLALSCNFNWLVDGCVFFTCVGVSVATLQNQIRNSFPELTKATLPLREIHSS